MRKAPWVDSQNNELFDGDTIVHPDGQTGTIEFHCTLHSPTDQWLVNYGDGVPSRLCLQIGDKGRAVKLRRSHHRIPLNHPDWLSIVRKWRYPWVLANARRYDTPIPYNHPKGAVTWVKLAD